MKTIFWNVDTQYDFMRDKGALAVSDAYIIEENLQTLTEFAHTKGVQIIFTGDWHTPDSSEFSSVPDYKQTYPPHCLINTQGAAFIPATTPYKPFIIDWQDKSLDTEALVRHKGDIVIYKDAFDVFAGSPHSETVLQIIQPSKVVVYGVAANVCVHYAICGLLQRGKTVYAVLDAMKGLPELPLEPLIKQWKSKGSLLVRTEDVLSVMDKLL